MTLKDVLLQHEDLHGIAKDTDDKVCELILSFREKIGPDSQCLPPNIYAAWFGREGEFARIGKLLLTDYALQPKPGFKLTDSFLTSSARSYKLEDFIFENFNFKVHFGSDNHQTLSYSKDKFFQLAQCAVAMVLIKYGGKSLTQAHIYSQMVTTLFRYFKIYSSDDYTWLINLADIQDVFRELLLTDLVSYQQLALTCGFAVGDAAPKSALSNRKKKPTCAEDLTECFSENMTQKEKTAAIMKWWQCSERTARRYMANYGLTESKYIRSDYKELHDHLDELSEQISDEHEALHAHIDVSTQQLSEKLETLTQTVTQRVDDAFDRWLQQQSGGYRFNRLKSREEQPTQSFNEAELRARINAAFAAPLTPSNE